MARVLDGKVLAAKVRAEVTVACQRFRDRCGRSPVLHFVLVGDDPASVGHVERKTKIATEVGIAAHTHRLPASASNAQVVDRVGQSSGDADVDGILVQLPLPSQLDPQRVLVSMDPRKDVDGLHPTNVAALFRGQPQIVPCTPAGCVALIDLAGEPIAGKRALVIGRSELVGRPTAALLVARDATVTLAHSKTRDVAAVCREADIVVAAAGRPKLVAGDWIKPGAIVIDVGIHRDGAGKLCGDVDFAAAEAVASAITPVPGGVGPMTIAMLLDNTVRAAGARLG